MSPNVRRHECAGNRAKCVGTWGGPGGNTPCQGACNTWVTFGVHNWEKSVNAVCPAMRKVGGHNNFEHHCYGGGGYFREGGGRQCSDFSGWDWSGVRSGCQGGTGWSSSGPMTDSTVLMFYRKAPKCVNSCADLPSGCAFSTASLSFAKASASPSTFSRPAITSARFL